MLGLYIHIPFCRNICNYCDFCKTVSSSERKKIYTKALLEEMKLKKLDNYSFDTLYIGGGTPSSLPLEELETIFIELHKNINFKKIVEFTIEANPEDITYEFVDLIKRYHVNRISIGVQTLSPFLQKMINRHVEFDYLKEKIDCLKQNGIENINIDLMYAIPGQTMKMLDEDLGKISLLDVKHISYYSLILEEKTVFYYLYKRGELELMDEELESKMYHHINSVLKKRGFKHYETSNFAKGGYQSKHNLIYWNCNEYVALGPSGSSYLNKRRFTNTHNLTEYINGLNEGRIILDEEITLNIEEQKEEEIILGLRKCEGVNKYDFFNKFNEEIKTTFPNIDKLIDEGLLVENKNHIYIPEKLFYISNHIISKILQ